MEAASQVVVGTSNSTSGDTKLTQRTLYFICNIVHLSILHTHYQLCCYIDTHKSKAENNTRYSTATELLHASSD